MSRVQGFTLMGSLKRMKAIDKPIIYECSDLAEKTVRFLCPSLSVTGAVHSVEVSLRTGEIDCPCKRNHPFRNTRNSPVSFSNASYAEALARNAKVRLQTTLYRAPKGLCRHGKLVRRWFHRAGLWHLMESAEKFVIERLETVAQKQSA